MSEGQLKDGLLCEEGSIGDRAKLNKASVAWGYFGRSFGDDDDNINSIQTIINIIIPHLQLETLNQWLWSGRMQAIGEDVSARLRARLPRL